MKPKNGTSWGYEYCTLDIIGDYKLTLDVIPINALLKNYSVLTELLFKKLESMSMKIRATYLDKEFCNDDTISVLTKLKINCVIACKSNKKSKRNLRNSKKKMDINQLFLNINLTKMERNLILFQCLMKRKITSYLLQIKM